MKIHLSLVIVLSIITLLFNAAHVNALSDEQYKEMLKESPEYAEAEKKLSRAWAKLKETANPMDMERYEKDQAHWVGKGRDQEVTYLISDSSKSPYKNEVLGIVRDGKTDVALTYALVTTERAAKLTMLVEQEKDGHFSLTGKFAQEDGKYVFYPFPFSVPFTICSLKEADRLPPGFRNLLVQELKSNEPSLVDVKGSFQLPGVFSLERPPSAKVREGGMGWREQDRYLVD